MGWYAFVTTLRIGRGPPVDVRRPVRRSVMLGEVRLGETAQPAPAADVVKNAAHELVDRISRLALSGWKSGFASNGGASMTTTSAWPQSSLITVHSAGR